MSSSGFTVGFLTSQGAIMFDNNIGIDLDLRTNLSGAIPCEFANATRESPFAEVERMTVLAPI